MRIIQDRDVRCRGVRRRGAAAVSVAVCGTVILGFAALAIDVGMLYHVRAEAQRSADAAALAGAWKLLDEERLHGGVGLNTVIANTRQSVSSLAGDNQVFNSAPSLDANTANAADGDIVIGCLNDLFSLSEPISTQGDPAQFNAISVHLRRDSERNGPIPLLFAQVLGLKESEVATRAMAAISDAVAGFKVTQESGNAEIIPLALHIDAWRDLIAASENQADGVYTTGDHYRADAERQTVSAGPDKTYELDLYPGAGPTHLPPGNFGTVDIGNPNNSTPDISRQIRYGLNAEDLAYFGGELKFDANGQILLEGDTGLSAAIKDDLTAIIGQPRVIPLFSEVNGPGNNSVFKVVAFAGIRVLDVKLSGPMAKKHVIIQPAVVVSDAVIIDKDVQSSYFVYAPPRLVR